MRLFLGNFISFIASVFMIYSCLQKEKEKVFYFQFIQSALLSFSSIFFNSYSGMISYTICAVRNLLVSREDFNYNSMLVSILLTLIIGLYTNNLGLIGLLPIIATIQYTLCSFIKNIILIKLSIIINSSIWSIYSFFINNLVTGVIELIIVFIATYSIFKLKLSKTKLIF